MPRIFQNYRLSEFVEVFILIVFGIISQAVDGSPFSIKARWKSVWDMEIPKEFFSIFAQNLIKTALSLIVVARCSTTYLYVLSSLLVIACIITNGHPKLMLPWLLIAGIKSIGLTLLETIIGVYVCSSFKQIEVACIEFIIQKAVEMLLSSFLWFSILDIYSTMMAIAQAKPTECEEPLTQESVKKADLKRRRARSMIDESTLRKTAGLNYFEFKDVPKILMEMLKKEEDLSKDSLLPQGMMLASISNMGSFDNLKTSQSLGELGSIDLKSLQVVGLDEFNEPVVEKALKFMKLTREDVKKAKKKRKRDINDLYYIDQDIWEEVSKTGRSINRPKQRRPEEIFVRDFHRDDEPLRTGSARRRTRTRAKSVDSRTKGLDDDTDIGDEDDESAQVSMSEVEEHLSRFILMSNLKEEDPVFRIRLESAVQIRRAHKYADLYRQQYMSIIGPEVFDNACKLKALHYDKREEEEETLQKIIERDDDFEDRSRKKKKSIYFSDEVDRFSSTNSSSHSARITPKTSIFSGSRSSRREESFEEFPKQEEEAMEAEFRMDELKRNKGSVKSDKIEEEQKVEHRSPCSEEEEEINGRISLVFDEGDLIESKRKVHKGDRSVFNVDDSLNLKKRDSFVGKISDQNEENLDGELKPGGDKKCEASAPQKENEDLSMELRESKEIKREKRKVTDLNDCDLENSKNENHENHENFTKKIKDKNKVEDSNSSKRSKGSNSSINSQNPHKESENSNNDTNEVERSWTVNSNSELPKNYAESTNQESRSSSNPLNKLEHSSTNPKFPPNHPKLTDQEFKSSDKNTNKSDQHSLTKPELSSTPSGRKVNLKISKTASEILRKSQNASCSSEEKPENAGKRIKIIVRRNSSEDLKNEDADSKAKNQEKRIFLSKNKNPQIYFLTEITKKPVSSVLKTLYNIKKTSSNPELYKINWKSSVLKNAEEFRFLKIFPVKNSASFSMLKDDEPIQRQINITSMNFSETNKKSDKNLKNSEENYFLPEESASFTSVKSEESFSLYYSKTADLTSPIFDVRRFIYPDRIHYSYQNMKEKGFDVDFKNHGGLPLIVRESLTFNPCKNRKAPYVPESNLKITKRPMDLSFAMPDDFNRDPNIVEVAERELTTKCLESNDEDELYEECMEIEEHRARKIYDHLLKIKSKRTYDLFNKFMKMCDKKHKKRKCADVQFNKM